MGYEDEQHVRHEGRPDDLTDTYGVLVHAYDFDTNEEDYFWAWAPGPFDTWDEWIEYVYTLMGMYGMSLE